MDGSNHNMNMSAWENLRGVDRKFTKAITGKTYKGDSPNPTYIIRKLTEIFGPIGHRWGFEVKFDRVRKGAPHRLEVARSETKTPPDAQGVQHTLARSSTFEIIREEHHEVCIDFWQIGEDKHRRIYSSYGGTPMLYKSKAGKWVHDEDAAKKSLTDAYVKAASWLGAAADIFLGLYDDKYGSMESDEPPMQPPSGGPMPRPPSQPQRSGNDDWQQPTAPNVPAQRANTASDAW